MCVEGPRDYAAVMHLWRSSSTSLWLGLFHVTGIRIMRCGGGCERKEPAQAAEVCIASLYLSLVPHGIREILRSIK